MNHQGIIFIVMVILLNKHRLSWSGTYKSWSHTWDGSFKWEIRIQLQNSANGDSPTDKTKQKEQIQKNKIDSPPMTCSYYSC